MFPGPVFETDAGTLTPFPSSRRTSSVKPVPALHVVSHVGKNDHGLDAFEPDGADEQPHPFLLLGKDMLHLRPDAQLRDTSGLCHRPLYAFRPPLRIIFID